MRSPPGAKILLVEATTNSFANLLAAEDYAKTHAGYVSNSWDGGEFSGETAYDPRFSQPGVSFFVSSGDSALPALYPSASPNVISVGGTSLNSNPFPSTNFVSETGWSGSGGGCSAYETANPGQAAFSQYGQVSCGGARATPDVSLVADPNTGVAIYDSLGWEGLKGWIQIGGTSASSPMWAARSADSGSVVDALVRVRQPDHLPRHHARQQWRTGAGRVRPRHGPRQLGRDAPVADAGKSGAVPRRPADDRPDRGATGWWPLLSKTGVCGKSAGAYSPPDELPSD